MMQEKQVLFEAHELARAINRMGHEVIEQSNDAAGLVLIGIRSSES